MEEVVPRFEFRVFAPSLERVEGRLRGVAEVEEEVESSETYLVSRERNAWSRNVKIRGSALEMKLLIERRDGLERWKPVAKKPLPLSREFVGGPLGPDLGVDPLDARRASFSLVELVREVIGTHSRVAAAWVEKKRWKFRIDGCRVEFDEVKVNGAVLQTVAAESEDAGHLLRVIDRLELENSENVSYPRAVRRVMGIEAAPGQPWFEP